MFKSVAKFLFVLFVASVVWAQTDQTGVIKGKVFDENGDPVPGVTIRSALGQ